MCLLLLVIACIAGAAEPSDTVFARDYGVKPNTFENMTVKLQHAIKACKDCQAKVLVLDEGRYDIWPEGATRREMFITNTSTEEECPSKVKTFGVLFEDMSGLTVEGNGATLMFHGKQTMISFMHCRQMTLRHLHVDCERPGASEITISRVDNQGVEATLHRDSRYSIIGGRLNLIGEGWRTNRPHCIEYDPDTERFCFSRGWQVLSQAEAKEVSPGVVRFATPPDFKPKTGNVLTVRDIIRDQVGLFIYESSDITFEQVGIHYMHGLGIVSQYSRNLTMSGISCAPREGSGRILASSADFMHFSGCSGKIVVKDCYFAGAQDDPINIHGTNLRAISQTAPRTLRLRFMHGQSYGYNAYFVGDTVAFVHAATMERFAMAVVKSVVRESDRIVEVTFDRDIPTALEIGHDCVENITCTPEVEIRNNYFTRTSTRGTLVTTPRRVVIENNVYCKTGMSTILIEGDAEGWYESGPVKDVTIRGNKFIDCAYTGGPEHAVIALHPSNTVVNANRPVHQGIRIEGNIFQTHGNPLLYAKSTSGITFINNEVKNPQGDSPLFIFNGSKDITIKGNTIANKPHNAIKTYNMKKGYVKGDVK